MPKIDEAIAKGVITNMISNPTCAFSAKGEPGLKPGRVPKPFGTWSPKPKKGQEKTLIGVDTSCGDGDRCCLFIKGVPGGCVTFENDSVTPPGTWYYVKARVMGDQPRAISERSPVPTTMPPFLLARFMSRLVRCRACTFS